MKYSHINLLLGKVLAEDVLLVGMNNDKAEITTKYILINQTMEKVFALFIRRT
jgi:hypothetical protein